MGAQSSDSFRGSLPQEYPALNDGLVALGWNVTLNDSRASTDAKCHLRTVFQCGVESGECFGSEFTILLQEELKVRDCRAFKLLVIAVMVGKWV